MRISQKDSTTYEVLQTRGKLYMREQLTTAEVNARKLIGKLYMQKAEPMPRPGSAFF